MGDNQSYLHRPTPRIGIKTYLFSFVADETTSHSQDDDPSCILFVDDIIFLMGLVRDNVEILWEVLEFKWFRIFMFRTKYTECNFSLTMRTNKVYSG